MPIRETVSVLAKELEEQLHGITPSQAEMLAALRDMARYKEIEDLGAWNSRYKNSRKKKERGDTNFKAIELVYEIGRYNLFTEFDEGGTLRRYQIAQLELLKQGVLVSRSLDVSRW